jgi:hypothetical protein
VEKQVVTATSGLDETESLLLRQRDDFSDRHFVSV